MEINPQNEYVFQSRNYTSVGNITRGIPILQQQKADMITTHIQPNRLTANEYKRKIVQYHINIINSIFSIILLIILLFVLLKFLKGI